MKNSAIDIAREREREIYHQTLHPMSSSDSEVEDEPPPTWNGGGGIGSNKKRMMSKQLSMRETTREAKWEKRRRQILQRRRMMMMSDDRGGDIVGSDNGGGGGGGGGGGEEEADEATMEQGKVKKSRLRSLTDEDLDELRGSIELGFGFNEEDGGHDLCDTLPALDLYFAVNRQLSDPKMRFSPSPCSTPTTTSSASASTSTLCGTPSPRSPNQQQHSPGDYWKICNPGDDPQHVKTRLRHWAQVVACSVRQSR